MELLIFIPIALACVVLALMVVFNKSPIGSAVSLIGMMLCLAGVFALQSAHFIAILQVIVYAGAIMVLFMFVIMLLNLRSENIGGKIRQGNKVLTALGGALVFGILVKIICVILSTEFGPGKEPAADFGTTAKVGAVLFTDYVLPFETASILLLAAMVGALVLAKTKPD
jgi:NADH-quinone oxidoreductase subunit J